MVEIATGNRRFRTWFWTIALVWLIFVFILAAVVLPEMKQLGHVPTDRNGLCLYRTALLLFLGLPLVLMLYNAVLAAGALKHARFPPPTYPLLGNTRVLVGRPAKRKAWGSLLAAVIGATATSVLLLALIQ
jgi:hypothetical protein